MKEKRREGRGCPEEAGESTPGDGVGWGVGRGLGGRADTGSAEPGGLAISAWPRAGQVERGLADFVSTAGADGYLAS